MRSRETGRSAFVASLDGDGAVDSPDDGDEGAGEAEDGNASCPEAPPGIVRIAANSRAKRRIGDANINTVFRRGHGWAWSLTAGMNTCAAIRWGAKVLIPAIRIARPAPVERRIINSILARAS
jgi:hypothetical protein